MNPAPDTKSPAAAAVAASLAQRFLDVRSATLALCEGMEREDYVVQTMPDVSPTKWHLAHITWFFEHFLLEPRLAGYKPFHPEFNYLFNSYYYTVGKMHQRPERGLLSRPTVDEVRAYRAHVDEAMVRLIENAGGDGELQALVTLGMNHEQQHQELVLTDIKHVYSNNPLLPALRAAGVPSECVEAASGFVDQPGGIFEVGHSGDGFCFDNETPRHRVLVREHALARQPVSNGEYREFIEAGGYRDSEFWLSDGWSTVRDENWNRPLYWSEDLQSSFTLSGQRDLDADAPVCHVSFYEADAYARWAGARLPSEPELELAASAVLPVGNFVESGLLHPAAAQHEGPLRQIHGDVWEWTQSSYSPYPGFKPLSGSLGEYNGKFMCNQMVLRGGSCATPASHMRASYRNFFYPHQRWQFSGLRLATDR